MLVAMHNCFPGQIPKTLTTLQKVKDDRITALINVLVWENEVYPCKINEKAAKDLENYLVRNFKDPMDLSMNPKDTSLNSD